MECFSSDVVTVTFILLLIFKFWHFAYLLLHTLCLILVQLEALRANPFKGVLFLLLVLFSLSLEVFYLLYDAQRLEDIGYVIKSPCLGLEEKIILLGVLLAV